MKKAVFAVLFFACLSFGQNDYLNLNFGMSVNQVRQKGYNITLQANDDNELIATYADNSTLNPPLAHRTFTFHNDKLFAVMLYYENVLRAGVEKAIYDGLNNRYKLHNKWRKEGDSKLFAVVDDLEFTIFLQDINIGEMEVMIRGLKVLRQLEEHNRNKTKQNLGF